MLTKGFVPVVFEKEQQVRSFNFPTPVQHRAKTFSNPPAANSSVFCEISYPNGVCMKLSGLPDPEMLRTLVLLPQR